MDSIIPTIASSDDIKQLITTIEQMYSNSNAIEKIRIDEHVSNLISQLINRLSELEQRKQIIQNAIERLKTIKGIPIKQQNSHLIERTIRESNTKMTHPQQKTLKTIVKPQQSKPSHQQNVIIRLHQPTKWLFDYKITPVMICEPLSTYIIDTSSIPSENIHNDGKTCIVDLCVDDITKKRITISFTLSDGIVEGKIIKISPML